MDHSNLLSGGVDVLNEMKEKLLELHEYQAKHDTLISEEEKLEKSIHNVEKTVEEEIESTTKKRRQEIDDTFDKQLDKTSAKMKKMKEKRDKRKDLKVSERISEETAPLREENHRLRLEAKTLFKQQHVPAFCNTKLFFALYFPKFFEDILIIVCTLLLTLLIIPCSIYFFVIPQDGILYLILIYIITVIFFGGIYLLIENLTKDKHTVEMKQVGGLRSQIRTNRKKMKAIERDIKKDRDESSYGLENFDEELARLDKEAVEIAEQKKDALLLFENTTSQLIASEIRSRHEETMAGLKADYDLTTVEVSKAEDKIKALTIKIASEYEPFLGKDLMTLDRLDALMNIIQAGNAETVSEAVAFHRQNMK